MRSSDLKHKTHSLSSITRGLWIRAHQSTDCHEMPNNPPPILHVLALNCRIGYIQDHLILMGLWNAHHQHANNRPLLTTRAEPCFWGVLCHSTPAHGWVAFQIAYTFVILVNQVNILEEATECLKWHMNLQPMDMLTSCQLCCSMIGINANSSWSKHEWRVSSLLDLCPLSRALSFLFIFCIRFLIFVAFEFLDRVLWPCSRRGNQTLQLYLLS